MKKLSSVLAAVLLFAASAAQADVIWSWDLTGPSFAGSGTLTTAGDATTPEPVLDVTGQIDGHTILGLVPLGTDGGFLYNNLLDVSALLPFDYYGLLMDVVDLGHTNWYSNGQMYEYSYSGIPSGANSGSGIPISLTINRVPEPGSGSLVLFALFGLGLILVARKTSQPHLPMAA